MQNLSAKAKEQISSFKSITLQNGLISDSIIQKEYNYEFNITESQSKVKVLLYFGKKGLKLILQGDVNSHLYKTVGNLLNDQQTLDLGQKKIEEPDNYIGTDEVGKGDFFGPLVAAAVYVNEISRKKLIAADVRDSKEMSDYQIRNTAHHIKKIVDKNYSVIQINPARYNEIYSRFGNLNKMLNWTHSKAVENLLDTIDCKYIITDKFSNRELNISLSDKHNDVVFHQETKAEKYTGVAAASILARDSFLEWFESQAMRGNNFPKGSSETVEEFAKKFLHKIGGDKIGEYAKLHFKTFNKIKNK